MMRLYLAAIFTNNFGLLRDTLKSRMTENENRYRTQIPNFLESYRYIHKQCFVDEIRQAGKKIFLDSGAFSSFTKGANINIPDYCRYIENNIDIIECIDGNVCASVVDCIGSAQGTYENQMLMESYHIKPLPCFHYGEDERYLEWYVDNYSHITLGGMVPISTPQLHIWLDRIWNNYLIDKNGKPKLKVHGFGLTSIHLMVKYPWYSVDSSSWVHLGSNGSILYTGNWKPIAISDKSPFRKMANQHYETLPLEQKLAVMKHIESEGFSIERLKIDYLSRRAYNCMAFVKLQNKINSEKDNVFYLEQPTLF